MSPRFLEVKYEDLVQSPDRAYQRILMHLGVEPHPLDPTPITPADGSVIMTPSYEAVTRPIYKTAVARWKNYQPHFEAAERILAPAIEAFGY